MAKPDKPNQDKVEAEIRGMQQELRNLQEALGELVDAMITEAKPDFAEIKKLQTLKKKALSSDEAIENAIKTVKPKIAKTKAKPRKTKKPNP
ncbi:MAG: hypothetical protein NWF05_08440 [Candidatus Bathyarchaeota archaeon]|nr:hypothetical protein [Candidatus Bathyarchaeota archaeon]